MSRMARSLNLALTRLQQSRMIQVSEAFKDLKFKDLFVSPYIYPDWLSPFIDNLDNSDYRYIFLHAPPQVGKTSVLVRHLIMTALRSTTTNAYVSYNATRTDAVALLLTQCLEQLHIPYTKKKSLITLFNGSTIKFLSVRGGDLLGSPINGVIIMDDVYSSVQEATSPTINDNLDDWIDTSLKNRVHESGKIIMCMHRWHKDDFWARQYDWNKDSALKVVIPAVCYDPTEWEQTGRKVGEFLKGITWLSNNALQEAQKNKNVFLAMWQGTPTTSQLSRFINEPQIVKTIDPTWKLQCTYVGIDLAGYGKVTNKSDYCAAVRVDRYVTLRDEIKYVIADAYRKQTKAESFHYDIQRILNQCDKQTQIVWHCIPSEASITRSFPIELRKKIQLLTASQSKSIRAVDPINLWNQDDVFLLEAEWNKDFVREAAGFDVDTKGHDDFIDAWVSATLSCISFTPRTNNKPTFDSRKAFHERYSIG